MAVPRGGMRSFPSLEPARYARYAAFFQPGQVEEALALDGERVAGDPGVGRALEAGYAEGGYEGVQRRIADVWAVRVGRPGEPAGVRGIGPRNVP